MMLHGYSDSWFSFSRLLPALPPAWHVVVPDQRGHGDSDRPAEGYDINDMARDALELMDRLAIGSVTLVGHSMGSFVAQRMAALAPRRIASIVLAGSGPSLANDVVVELSAAVDALSDPVDPGFIREFQMSTLHRFPPDEFLRRVMTESAKLPARVWKQVMQGFLRAPECGAIQCPALVVWGEQDAIFSRREQEELLRRIPGAVLKVMRGVGHSPHWEDPAAFLHLLNDAVPDGGGAQDGMRSSHQEEAAGLLV